MEDAAGWAEEEAMGINEGTEAEREWERRSKERRQVGGEVAKNDAFRLLVG